MVKVEMDKVNPRWEYRIVVGVRPRNAVLFATWNCGTDLNVVAPSKQNKHIVMIDIAS